MYSWYLATESHTWRVARICSGMHRVCTRSSVTRRLRWSWVPASHQRRAMTRRLSARSLDCEDESAAGKDDGRSLNALARAQLGHTWAEVGLCAGGPSNVPTLPITPPTSLSAVAPPAIPLSKEMEGSSSQARRRSWSGGREGDIESGRRSARQPRERARGRPRAAVWERESEEQQQPSARGASGEDPETAALRQS